MCVWGGGVSAEEGVSAQGGVCRGEGCLPGGECKADPPVNRMTDRCKNFTLPQLRCGR